MDKLYYYDKLRKLDVSKHVEKKQQGNISLTYLSWAWAFDEVLKLYPSMTYEVLRFENNLPYVFDKDTGYMVFTKIKIDGVEREMFLPVMNGANKAMMNKPYKYKTKYEEKEVDAATMFDINKTIMRCLVKNLAMFGLGMYIYAGEDLPEGDTMPKQRLPTEDINGEPIDKQKAKDSYRECVGMIDDFLSGVSKEEWEAFKSSCRVVARNDKWSQGDCTYFKNKCEAKEKELGFMEV